MIFILDINAINIKSRLFKKKIVLKKVKHITTTTKFFKGLYEHYTEGAGLSSFYYKTDSLFLPQYIVLHPV